METAMRRWMLRRTRPIGWTVAVAFAVALSARCAPGAEMTDAQKACCAAMGHDCGRMAQKEDCCSHQSQTVQQFFATVKGAGLALVAPSPVLLPFAVSAATLRVSSGGDFGQLTQTSPKPARVPQYLLTSALLI